MEPLDFTIPKAQNNPRFNTLMSQQSSSVPASNPPENMTFPKRVLYAIRSCLMWLVNLIDSWLAA